MNKYSEMLNKKRIHLLGIGGVSMSAVALLLKDEGHIVTGRDDNESLNVLNLREKGIDVSIGVNLENVEKADLIIYTTAFPDTDPEKVLAKKLNKEIIERADFMGLLTDKYNECICISGTHGKTTTTSMTSICFLEAKKDPSIQVGAYLKNIDSNFKIGKSEYLVIESCEYKDSFLKFNPNTAVVLNIDLDHADYFKDVEDVKKSFVRFMKKVPKGGKIIVNGDDENIKDILSKNEFDGEIITVGKTEDSNYYFANEEYAFEKTDKDVDGFNTNREYMEADIYKNKEKLGRLRIYVLGTHNMFNALVSAAISLEYGISFEDVKKALLKFEGASRRFEYKGKVNGARVFDDYAHHPTEITSLGEAVKKLDKRESYAVLEIHTFKRAEMFENEFGKALKNFDNIIIAPIYRARKENVREVSQEEIKNKILEADKTKNVIYMDNYKDIEKYLLDHVKHGDVIFTIGAGNVTKLADALIKDDEGK